MIYCFNPEECARENVSSRTFLFALSLYLNEYIGPNVFEEMCVKGFIEYDGFDLLGQPVNPRLTQRGVEMVESILSRSKMANPQSTDKRLENLANSLMDIFPKGKKEGTNNMYWRCNMRENIKSLERFFLKYGYGTYTDEQILEAAKRYVNPANGNMTNVRVLKYFIIKNVRDVDDSGQGYIREVSDLATMLDNPEDIMSNNEDWQTSVR